MDTNISNDGIRPDSIPDHSLLLGYYIGLLDSTQKSFCDACAAQALEEVLRSGNSASTGQNIRSITSRAEKQDIERSASRRTSLKSLAIGTGTYKRIVPVQEIIYISTNGSCVNVFTEAETFQSQERMKTLEEHLSPNRFYRIHRSHIVRLNQVKALVTDHEGSYRVRMKDSTELPVSRRRRAALEDRLGLLP